MDRVLKSFMGFGFNWVLFGICWYEYPKDFWRVE